ncbi:nucleotidyltransferase domain-containing protein [Propionivibrio sp.]|uniref:nucleotidyltransferase domain-containing protein n=1 Tax=Propionivibrio sp. TaxID=2212460 RepID=UPI003BF3FAD1
MLDENAIQEAAHRLASVASQPACIILFGSYARGNADEASDLDLLVVEESLDDKAGEYMRLRGALGGLTTGVDLLLLSRRDFERRRQVKGTMPHRAHHEGRVLYDAAV